MIRAKGREFYIILHVLSAWTPDRNSGELQIDISFPMFIGFSPVKMGKLCTHHCCQVFPDCFPDIKTGSSQKYVPDAFESP